MCAQSTLRGHQHFCHASIVARTSARRAAGSGHLVGPGCAQSECGGWLVRQASSTGRLPSPLWVDRRRFIFRPERLPNRRPPVRRTGAVRSTRRSPIPRSARAAHLAAVLHSLDCGSHPYGHGARGNLGVRVVEDLGRLRSHSKLRRMSPDATVESSSRGAFLSIVAPLLVAPYTQARNDGAVGRALGSCFPQHFLFDPTIRLRLIDAPRPSHSHGRPLLRGKLGIPPEAQAANSRLCVKAPSLAACVRGCSVPPVVFCRWNAASDARSNRCLRRIRNRTRLLHISGTWEVDAVAGDAPCRVHRYVLVLDLSVASGHQLGGVRADPFGRERAGASARNYMAMSYARVHDCVGPRRRGPGMADRGSRSAHSRKVVSSPNGSGELE